MHFLVKNRSFWGLWKIFWESTSDFFFFTGKAKVHWLGIKVEQFELSSFAEPKSPAETFTATLTSFSDPRLQGPRRALCAIRSHLAVES
jgi:hypothetical protein